MIEHIFTVEQKTNLHERTLSVEQQKRLVTIACELYPSGIAENRIWAEAGGDISAIATNTNGKTQWREAIKKISHGGGGNITYLSLIQAMLEDNANNKSLMELLGILSK